MRIIAGEKKGRKLNSPKDDLIRPTPDKVKGAIFSMMAEKVLDSTFVDLFAGSGAIGLEALSRGAKKVFFGDHDTASVNLTKKNIEHLDYQNSAEVLHGDFKEVLAEVKEKADIIFLDPPYNKGFYDEILEAISKSDALRKDGVVIVERDSFNQIPDEAGDLVKTDTRKYGKTAIDIFKFK